ncbi:prephenate dehydrogenase [Aeromicrobium sp. SMF47]|uniref:Prephenate dehydrogenase n=1 Tax=Aeromicrobium yanjiei TaxID=2662028 RepID=A0A5Q2MES8_9ACTN|nr:MULTISPECIES: prephenate dehydrogenase [Aeromicrobium]MRJ77241.1 prephenate dehydrogenase [Aeromicrobium yanjiei]MRK01609.1 prephenate dehydrogenase [Aeromicrobium sp. S22]QGG41624.1 prephenate dehydrogenase [Aeromicrobium yanjiei]
MSAAAPRALPGPVLVIGCGLIGTSIGLALRAHEVDVLLADAEPGNVEAAASRGAGRPATDHVEPYLVVAAVPPTAAADVVVQALRRWPAAYVTDVTSVKAGLQREIDAHPGAERFAGGHPMAGSERSGPMAGSAQLFEGRPWAVTPGSATLPEALDAVVDMALHVGAVPIILEAAAHDRAVALVSHVPQVMSTLTAARLNDAQGNHLALAGPGLRDTTRIAGSDSALWIDILGTNAADVRAVLELVRADLDRVIDALGQDDAVIGDVLESGRRGTEQIPGKHGSAPARVDIVHVQVADRPGELSRLMTDTGQSGVNIEDLRLDHDLGRPVGLAEIAVALGVGDSLVDALTARGWTAYR